jgi:hypothetical protein
MLLINFNVLRFKDGLKRMVNKLEPPRPSAPSAVKPTTDPKQSWPARITSDDAPRVVRP